MKGIYLAAYKAYHKNDDMNTKEHQGGYNVHQVIETFLDTIGANKNESN